MADKPEPFEGPYREAAKRRVKEMAAVFAADQVITEAAVAGPGHSSSVGGARHPETDEDAELIFEVLPRLARECGTLTGTRGGATSTPHTCSPGLAPTPPP